MSEQKQKKVSFEVTRALIGAPIEALNEKDYESFPAFAAFAVFALPGAIAYDTLVEGGKLIGKIVQSVKAKK